jgi:hypothetical protein
MKRMAEQGERQNGRMAERQNGRNSRNGRNGRKAECRMAVLLHTEST